VAHSLGHADRNRPDLDMANDLMDRRCVLRVLLIVTRVARHLRASGRRLLQLFSICSKHKIRLSVDHVPRNTQTSEVTLFLWGTQWAF
jgi:hypothetical protein